jgi:hypothetical protein
MKRILCIAALLSSVTGQVFAQRHHPGFGFRGLGTPPAHRFLNRFPGMVPRFDIGTAQQTSFNLGIPPLSAIPPLGVNVLGQDVITPGMNRFGGHRFPGGFDGFGFGGFPPMPAIAEGYGYGAGAPSIIVLQPIQMPYQAPRPPESAHAIVHDYRQPAETAGTSGQPVFTLAMRDGSRHDAILVWVQNGAVHYIDPTGRTEHVPLNTLDRGTTHRLNQEKNIELHLPELDG